MTILIAIGVIILAIVFSWPWVYPYLLRHDATARLLDRLEEEWDREVEPDENGWKW